MIQSAFPIQLLIDWYLHAPSHPLPTFLKELLRNGEVRDYKKLEDFLTNELQQTSLQDEAGMDFFFRLYRHGLLYAYYRQDATLFPQVVEIFGHRKQAFRNLSTTAPLAAWEAFSQLVHTAFQRVQRAISIEAFEEVSNLDWAGFEGHSNFISDLSAVIGFVYRYEDGPDQHQKARIWLQKGMIEQALPAGMMQHLLMIDYVAARGSQEMLPFLERVVENINQASEQAEVPEVQRLLKSVSHLAHGYHNLLPYALKEKAPADLAQFSNLLTSYESQVELIEAMPHALQAERKGILGTMYQLLADFTEEEEEKTNFSQQCITQIEEGISQFDNLQDELSTMRLRLSRAEMAIRFQQSITEKELKEVVQFYKKRLHFIRYVQAVETYMHLLIRNKVANKGGDLIAELFKLGQKRLEQGGFYLIAEGLRLANYLYIRETRLPGVSWMVAELPGFFERVEQAIEIAEYNYEEIGKTLVEQFRAEFVNFEPVSHYHITVYYRYQYAEVLMIRLGAIINQDSLSLRIADQLMKALDNKSNPMNIMKAEWDDFKKVPNFVRNHTLNKCISITKGDLPAAAEHLDFSYRNLRSYITFKEVNRLGFFLDLQQTNNRQLEQGIRYMFYDLYKTGTIFEVVFDMPKFLVDHAKSGFFSQDLEEALNIKGTTAKKYIKIMIEIGLIRQDKATGRKHYYRLIRENVMNRLGKDQNTLIEAAQQ